MMLCRFDINSLPTVNHVIPSTEISRLVWYKLSIPLQFKCHYSIGALEPRRHVIRTSALPHQPLKKYYPPSLHETSTATPESLVCHLHQHHKRATKRDPWPTLHGHP